VCPHIILTKNSHCFPAQYCFIGFSSEITVFCVRREWNLRRQFKLGLGFKGLRKILIWFSSFNGVNLWMVSKVKMCLYTIVINLIFVPGMFMVNYLLFCYLCFYTQLPTMIHWVEHSCQNYTCSQAHSFNFTLLTEAFS
jgi:hypothetical protein